ncbi:hypothetical protein [Marinobacterium aestuariivivens]|uniref:Uncharacterized protein n=1 Tax=Marinobacterium aestuariivivens TaxID=1698799 RepID=A0ABW2A9T3_9GAMM
MSKRKTIYSALPIVAAAYGEKFGVKVAIGGDTAYTDGKTIVVPKIPDNYPNMDAVWGYLAHEAGHVRFTDFTVNRRPGLHADLSNVFEDCRIERGMIGIYPGTAQTLSEVARYMAQAGHYQHVTKDSSPASILEGFCLYWLQSQAVGQTVLQPYLDSAKVALEETFPRGVVVRLNALLRKVVDAQSTAEAVALTEEVMKMLEEEKEKEEKKQQQQQQQQQQANQGQQQQQGSNDSSDGQGDSQGQQGQQDQKDGQEISRIVLIKRRATRKVLPGSSLEMRARMTRRSNPQTKLSQTRLVRTMLHRNPGTETKVSKRTDLPKPEEGLAITRQKTPLK